jgi:FO synthase
VERLTIYPAYVHDPDRWLAPELHRAVLDLTDADGLPRADSWCTGAAEPPPRADLALINRAPSPAQVAPEIRDIVRAAPVRDLDAAEIARLFAARGADFAHICHAADELCQSLHHGRVSYIVNCNINYTNICGYRCRFCAFSKGRVGDDARDPAYLLSLGDIAERCREARARDATEVCMQGGIHPEFTGQTYLDICHAVEQATPELHIHAFSPLEVAHGAGTLGISVAEFLTDLKAMGLATLPGTAAEILDDEIRQVLCADKITTGEWLDIVGTAHRLGIRTTATILFGHIERPIHWARHLLAIKSLQRRHQGFTEFVPLPFVAREAPIYRRGLARRGPTFREAVLMHAVARLVLHPEITNIQASWVKLGPAGVQACLKAGVNDLGGTLMHESISRAAGAEHGQEMSAAALRELAAAASRTPWQRTTLYQPVGGTRT